MSEYGYNHPDAVNVADLAEEARAGFIQRTYAHLMGAIAAFTLLEVAFFKLGYAEKIFMAVQGKWMLVLGGFMLCGWVARSMAHAAKSPAAQYGGLALYVVMEVVIFAPLLFICDNIAHGVIESAAAVTIAGFVALTAIAFVTKKDFSFLRTLLMWGAACAALLILGSFFFGLTLGLGFSIGMVALAGGGILYTTSNIIHHYPEDCHVAASLELFASAALMFWYVIQIFLAMRD